MQHWQILHVQFPSSPLPCWVPMPSMMQGTKAVARVRWTKSLYLTPGQTLEVRATDPTVVVDLPAWCRLTGHTLIDQQGDRYLIRRKD